uniref:hypothetical protein n=1 Tax=Flavobacterium sp. TaxID=239 RepID=UPI00404776D8
MMKFTIQDTFTTQLPADQETVNTRRQVYEAAYSFVTPRVPSNPAFVHVADDVDSKFNDLAGDKTIFIWVNFIF